MFVRLNPVVCLVCVLIGGCGAPSAVPPLRPSPAIEMNVPPMDPFAGESQAITGNNRFACDLYVRLSAKQSGNLFVSPVSISTAMAMTYAGAKGQTAEQIAKVMHFDLPPPELHADFGKLLGELRTERPGCQLRLANRLWGRKGLDALPEFLETTGKNYGAEMAALDFANQSEESRQTINGWVAEQTKDKIQNLIPPGLIDATTSVVLTSAIYFKGDWASKFVEGQTQVAPFDVNADKQVDVRLMHQRGQFRWTRIEGVQILELPYVGDEQSMIVLLPPKGEGVSKLESQLTAENLSAWIAQLSFVEVDVFLPKFRLTAEVRLADSLRALGMTAAFDATTADFSGITGSQDMYLSEVVHKAYVDVNEQGTEAAAATAVMGMRGPAETPEFRADHPFVFLIKDHRTGNILFMGRFSEPAGS